MILNENKTTKKRTLDQFFGFADEDQVYLLSNTNKENDVSENNLIEAADI